MTPTAIRPVPTDEPCVPQSTPLEIGLGLPQSREKLIQPLVEITELLEASREEKNSLCEPSERDEVASACGVEGKARDSVDQNLQMMRILRGDFSNLPPPKTNIIRIFLSSTFSGDFAMMICTNEFYITYFRFVYCMVMYGTFY